MKGEGGSEGGGESQARGTKRGEGGVIMGEVVLVARWDVGEGKSGGATWGGRG